MAGSAMEVAGELLVRRFTHPQTGHRTYVPGETSGDSVATLHRVHLILSGQIDYSVEDRTFTLEAGDQTFATAWIRRRWRIPGPQPCTFVFFAFSTTEMLSTPPGLYVRHLSPAGLTVEREMFERLHARHIDYIEDKDQLLAEGEVKGSLARFFEGAERCDTSPAPERARGVNPLVHQAQGLLLEHLADPQVLRRLNRELPVTPGYLRKLFHTATGQTLGAFLISARMQRARHLLHTTEMPVKQVARQVGFNDPLHFSRRYAAHWKMPPSQDRRPRDFL